MIIVELFLPDVREETLQEKDDQTQEPEGEERPSHPDDEKGKPEAQIAHSTGSSR